MSKYCQYLEKMLREISYIGQRLTVFHFSFGKKYVNELMAELKSLQIKKKN